MTDYLRVKQADTGHELTVTQEQVDAADGSLTVLKKDAVDEGGQPLPPTYRRSVEDAGRARHPKKAAAKAEPESGQQADSEGDN